MSDTMINTGITPPPIYTSDADTSEAWASDFEIKLVQAESSDPMVSATDVEGLPLNLVQFYARLARRHAVVREVDRGVWVATVVGLDGAYGDGSSYGEACDSLEEAIIGWVAVKRRLGASDIPPMEGLDLNPAS